jgi:hypothetical protein
VWTETEFLRTKHNTSKHGTRWCSMLLMTTE